VAGLPSLGLERTAAPDVVDVTVGVDEGSDRIVRPRAHGRDHCPTGGGTGRVDHDQSVAGAHDRRMGERLDDRDAVGEFGQLLGDPVGRLVGDTGVDDARRQGEQVGHRRSRPVQAPGSRGRPRRRSPRMLRSTFEVPPMIV
jgi:hypothetical protein